MGDAIIFRNLVMLHTCDWCRMSEERVLTDSWTGKALCPTCLFSIIGQLTLSPSDGDNLEQLLEEQF